MKIRMKNLIQRTIFGAIYIATIIAALTLSEWVFLAICMVFIVFGTMEFYELSNGRENVKLLPKALDVFGGLSMMWLVVSLAQTSVWRMPIVNTEVTFMPLMVYLISRIVVQLYTKENNPLNNLAYSFMCLLYVALPVALMPIIYYVTGGPLLLLAMFVMIWCNDTGAYVIGSKFGQHGRYRLFPRISPKKSWEGFFGGILFSIIAAILMNLYVIDTLSMTKMIGLALVVSIFATWGDLAESLIKRTVGVKDSGKFMPGHGGILDRIDSLLLVVPVMLCYLMICL